MTCSMGPTGEWVAWAEAARTENMYFMLVTLEVSKVSGWLNARAFCRVHRQGIDDGGGIGDEGDLQAERLRACGRKQHVWRNQLGMVRSARKTCSSCS